jgi:hypothetical protein
MLPDCIPIPELTTYFKEISNGPSPLLTDFLRVTESLRFLNTVVMATVDAHRLWHLDTTPSSIVARAMRSYNGAFPPSLEDFDFIDFVWIVITHLDAFKDVHPGRVQLYEMGQSRPFGELWLIGCAIHPDADLDYTLDPVLGPFLGLSPYIVLTCGRPTNFDLLGLSSCLQIPDSHPMPELAIALEQVFKLRKTDARLCGAQAIQQIIRSFVRIGLNIVDAWQLTRHHNTAQADALSDWGQEYQVRKCVSSACRFTLQNPHSGLPFPIRAILARTNIESIIDEISNGLIPKLVNRGTPVDLLSFEIYKWIMQAAVHPYSTHVAEVGDVVREHFDMCWASEQWTANRRTELAHFRPLDLPQEVYELIPTPETDDALCDFADEQREIEAICEPARFEAAGAVIDPFEVASIVTPDLGDVCAICQEAFEIEQGWPKCLQLKTCGHRFCAPCLEEIVNGVYPGIDDVPCPCCRKGICARRQLAQVN